MTLASRRALPYTACLIAFVFCAASAFAAGPSFQVLTALQGVSNGGQPWATPIADKHGNLYGTTSEGGNGPCKVGKLIFGCGVVYELSPPSAGNRWIETLLYQFQGGSDGYYPVGSLVMDASGNLYGTTESGGTANAGAVFELTPPASGSGPWTKTTIYNFLGGTAGAAPESGMIFDKAGNLYGTAFSGGICVLGASCTGVVYELSPPSSGASAWTETVIYTFQGTPDGAEPESTLVLSNGNLYGTTEVGGSTANCESGCGTVFELSPPASPGGAWTETIVHSFDAFGGDGQTPRSGLVLSETGTFYGATEFGGASVFGSVYQLVPPAAPGGTWPETVLYSFGGLDGIDPFASLVIGSDGSLYGTTMFGGNNEYGNAFKLAPPSSPGGVWTETVLVDFSHASYPIAGLTFGKGGWLYGATLGGGETDSCATGPSGQALLCGDLFRVLP